MLVSKSESSIFAEKIKLNSPSYFNKRYNIVDEKKKKNGIVWLEFEILQLFPEVRHGVFLNLGLGEKNSPENPKRALDLLGIKEGQNSSSATKQRLKKSF